MWIWFSFGFKHLQENKNQRKRLELSLSGWDGRAIFQIWAELWLVESWHIHRTYCNVTTENKYIFLFLCYIFRQILVVFNTSHRDFELNMWFYLLNLIPKVVNQTHTSAQLPSLWCCLQCRTQVTAVIMNLINLHMARNDTFLSRGLSAGEQRHSAFFGQCSFLSCSFISSRTIV